MMDSDVTNFVDKVLVSRSLILNLLKPLADMCVEVEKYSTLPENSRGDRGVFHYNQTTLTLAQLRAIKKFYDEVAMK